jgi:hypothetical protein
VQGVLAEGGRWSVIWSGAYWLELAVTGVALKRASVFGFRISLAPMTAHLVRSQGADCLASPGFRPVVGYRLVPRAPCLLLGKGSLLRGGWY